MNAETREHFLVALMVQVTDIVYKKTAVMTGNQMQQVAVQAW